MTATRPPARLRTSRPALLTTHGFTLVELLVVITIVGVLIALLLPAVQSTRESARGVECQNNLRQVGLALLSHHDADRELPIGCVEWRCFSCGPEFRSLAWNAELLPWLEEPALHDAIDFAEAYDSPANAEPAARPISVFVCPSGERGLRLEQGRGPSDYGGIFGERITGPYADPEGVLIHEEAIALRQVTDGASHTLAVAEDVGFRDGQWINGLNLFDQSAAYVNAAPAFENDIRSDHPDGAFGLALDGSVRFLSEQMEPAVLAALCTRAGGDGVANDGGQP